MNMLQMLAADAEALVSSGYYDVPKSHRKGRKPSLRKALTDSHTFPIIAEVKTASPGRGRFSRHAPEDLIELYQLGGATALSVLTEPNHFCGSLEILGSASRTGLPTLMKDVVVSMSQVMAGARMRASAVLLIEGLSRLETTRLDIDRLITWAHDLGLEVLLEVSDEDEILRGLGRDADIIGINQRDLATMRVDTSKAQSCQSS
jgi:indole-3-glycerol phosphate synthase